MSTTYSAGHIIIQEHSSYGIDMYTTHDNTILRFLSSPANSVTSGNASFSGVRDNSTSLVPFFLVSVWPISLLFQQPLHSDHRYLQVAAMQMVKGKLRLGIACLDRPHYVHIFLIKSSTKLSQEA